MQSMRSKRIVDIGMMTNRSIKCYSELIVLPTLIERYEYLQLGGHIGEDTFGFDRWINQQFYDSADWKRIRREVILRDTIGHDCCELGMPGYPIYGRILVHHMVPIIVDDIREASEFLLNPEYLICCSDKVHRAIHYGDKSLLPEDYKPRTRNDTCPWKR